MIKNKLSQVTLQPIDEDLPFTVETDASDFAIAATLNQNSKPVAFYARTLSSTEQKHSSIEKEAYAIVEALRKWKHFKLITDQCSVSFMLDLKHPSKIKNNKIQRWGLELAPYDFTTIYRPGNLNCAPNIFSRAAAASISLPSLKSLDELHKTLCDPGITRLFHYVKIKNLLFSFGDVKNVKKACTDCNEVKVKFLKPKDNFNLIKATKSFERISLDFKGPLPTTSGNKYMLVIIDKYSRFPFVYACKNLKASTFIEILTDLFCIFGLLSYVHTDQGTNFMSHDYKSWLHSLDVPTSRTNRYNPRGNEEVERFNGII